MSKITIILLATLFVNVCFGQTSNKIDSTIQREVASFRIKGTLLTNKDSLFKVLKMKVIPLYSCTNSRIYFNLGHTYISLYPSNFDTVGHKLLFEDDKKQKLVSIDNIKIWGTNGEIPKRKLDSIGLVRFSHSCIRFPKLAFEGIYEPYDCTNKPVYKRSRDGGYYEDMSIALNSPFYRAFQSNDGRRIYICLLNGKDKDKYEVIWIISNGRYLTRLIDIVD